MKKCGYCGQIVTEEMIAVRKEKWAKNIKKALKKRKELGFLIGRPRKFDYKEIRNLRNQGFKYRDICKKLNVSMGLVQRAIKSGIE